jgi:hypothetical protein
MTISGVLATRVIRSGVLAVLCLVPPATLLGQEPGPVQTPTEMTADMEAAIREGVDLHEKGQFDEAIARYEGVLAKSPGNVVALFERAFSELAKRDFDKAIETARTGAQYKSDLLPMFYDVMASALDSKGQPQQAIEAYRRGIALAPNASQLYFNMAVTYRESLKDNDQARQALEQAAALEPLHGGVQLLLGQVFQSSGYTTPALLALSTFLIIEPGGPQGLQGYGLWRAILKGTLDPLPDAAAADAATRAMMPKPPQKTDEGDFSATDRQLGPSYQAMLDKMDDGTSEIAALVGQVDAVLGTLVPQPTGERARSFVNVHYVPFFVALRSKNYVEPFVYWASQRAPVPGVREWITANEGRVREFIAWASAYSWPRP